MDIQPQGCCYICMAKHFADAFFYINANFNTPRCVAVPERVIAALFQTTAAQNGFKIILIVSRFHWFVRAAGQQIGVLRQTGNGFFQEDYHIFRQRNNAYRRFAFRCLHDQARVSTLPDTLCRTFDPNRAVLEVNVRNAERTDLAKPQSSVCRKKNPCVLVIG